MKIKSETAENIDRIYHGKEKLHEKEIVFLHYL
jgi:hypothetical protein